MDWAHTKMTDKFEMRDEGQQRVILTYEGEKPFTLMQQPISYSETALPVFFEGILLI